MKYCALLLITLLLASCGSLRSGSIRFQRVDKSNPSKSLENQSEKQLRPAHFDEQAIFNPDSLVYPVIQPEIENAIEDEEVATENHPKTNKAESELSRRTQLLRHTYISAKSMFSPNFEPIKNKDEEPVTPTIKKRSQIVWGVFGMLWAAAVGLFGIMLIGGLAFMFDGFLMILMIALASAGIYFVLFGFVRYIAHMDTRVGQTEEGKTVKAFKTAGFIYLYMIAFALLALLVLAML